MPELPEVETIVRDIRPFLIGEKITDFWTNTTKAITFNGKLFANLKPKIKNAEIKKVSRIGKHILFVLSNNFTIAIHLRMTGQLLTANISDPKEVLAKFPYARHIFLLSHNKSLVFADVRKFGTIKLLTNDQLNALASKESDALDPNLTFEKFSSNFKGKKKKIKELLLDQTFISGIGNIYASEILFDAKIHPEKRADLLSITEIKRVYLSMQKILELAIKFRGTSVSDYRDSKGNKGGFQDVLKVYQKHGKRCPICATIIARSVLGQRSTFYCPACQKIN